jgi:hypothetical protein
MGLPTITRAKIFTEDWLNLTTAQPGSWVIDSGVTATTDGDVLSLSGTISPNGIYNGNIGAFSTTTYPSLLVRAKANVARTLDFKFTFTDTTTQTITLSLTTSWQIFTNTLTSGKTTSDIRVSNQSSSGINSIDFIQIHKETLTLPTASKTVRQRTKRRVIAIPIWGKEGDVLQDGGSDSPEYDIAGQLVSTTSGQSGWTNTYTADQWWQLLNGLQLETGTAQADGNMTWQWFTFDEGVAKVVVVAFVADENPGRVQNWDFNMSLKQFDVIGRTFANPVGGVLATY